MRGRATVAALAAALCLPLAVPAAEASWGAIAIEPTSGKLGFAADAPTARTAQRRARHDCGMRRCKVAVWVFNGFGAVVRKSDGIYWSGIGRTRAQAFRDARRRAHEPAARRVGWVFSGLD